MLIVALAELEAMDSPNTAKNGRSVAVVLDATVEAEVAKYSCAAIGTMGKPVV